MSLSVFTGSVQNNKINHSLITVDGKSLMDCPLEPPNFVVDTLISQGLHILVGSPKVASPGLLCGWR